MDFRILGPLEALEEGERVALGGSRQRALLGVFLLHANETLSTDRLIDELWGERPPTTAGKTVQVRISRLRKALTAGSDDSGGNGLLVTRDSGYELRLDRDRLDSHRFERLAAEGRGELAAGRPEAAVSALERALSLWRGEPFGDLAFEPFAQLEIARLRDMRVAMREQLIDAKLALGGHSDVVGELEALIGENPLRERLRGQLMLALYRCERQADALQAYQDARRRLVEELGIEPGQRLRDLERAILAQDPALQLAPLEAAEPPPVLGASTPLVGREAEVDWLREQWRRSHGGAGRLVLIAGPGGMGKTRLAAELAAEAHRERGEVLYISRLGAPDAGREVLANARATRRPSLLVIDDADRAGDWLWPALAELCGGLAALPLLVLVTTEDAGLAARLDGAAILTLTPLDAGGVAAVARLYAGARDDMEPPVERLAEASGGIPRRVHRLASDWARGEAARRVLATAGRAATERAELRAAEQDLAGHVVDLQAIPDPAERDDDGIGTVVCPFKGLASFELEDADVFFGRERLVAEMVARLPGAQLMGIVGSSGSGKSSALRAGLLAALAVGVLPGSEGWTLALLRPGEHPMRALEEVTADAARERRLVLAVDQFEELFTACRDEPERAAFVDALVAHARDLRGRTIVLVAMRADFYGRCGAYPELSRLLGANHVLVGPMHRDELRRAIELPARRAGLRVEPDLVDALIADVQGEPGALPLLSTSLLELWQHRDGRTLRLSVYSQAGGVHGAVARLAERAFGRLDPGRGDIARRVLLRLAGGGEGDTVVRRRVPLAELEVECREEVAEVLSALAQDRLITISAGDVEVAHEALLREWPRLRGWLEEDAEGRRLQLHLRAAVSSWEAGGRDRGELCRGARLASTLDWARDHETDLNDVERAFLDESRLASERSQRRLRAMLAGVASLLVLAVIAGLVALEQRGNARDEAVTAAAQRLGAQALAEDDLDRSLLLARQGVKLDDSLQTRSDLLAALLKSPAAIGVLRGDGDRLISLDLSPDGRTLAFADNDGTVSFVDTRTRRPVAPPAEVGGHAGVIIDAILRLDHVRYSPNGSRIAVGGGAPVVLDARTHRPLARLRMPPDPLGRIVTALRFSPDGRSLFAVIALPPDRGWVIRRFDARSGRPLGRERYLGPEPATLMITHDGRELVTTDVHGTVIREARTLRELRRLPVSAEQAALSPDGRTMLAGGRDGSVRFVDLATGETTAASGRHDRTVERAIFSPNGRQAITAGEDGRVIVWDVEHAAAVETLAGHAAKITGLAISSDGSTLYSSSLDSKVLIWDLAGDRRLGRPFKVGPDAGELLRSSLSPDGRTLAVGQPDGRVTLLDATTLRALSKFHVVPEGAVTGIGFVPGGRLLAVGGDNGFLALVDPWRGEIVKRLVGHRPDARTAFAHGVFTPSFAADGRLMATTADDHTVRLWALPSGRPVGPVLRYPTVGDVSLSPDGRTLAVTVPEGVANPGVRIVDVATRRQRASLFGDEAIWDVARFTPDGRFLVGGSWKGWVRLWSTDTWKPASRPLTGHAGAILGQSMSPDGRTLATGSADGTIRLWDLRTEQPLGAALPGLPNRGVIPQFSPDGAHLFAVYDTGRAYRWDVRPSSWARHACAVAGRRLTRSEWEDALPDRAYDPAC
jgi:WD40 repeat protein/DNA-binding SARP family transcriptional activator